MLQEAERILGALAGRREELKAEIEGLRGVMSSALERLVVPSDQPDQGEATETSEPAEPDAVGESLEHAVEPDWATEIDEAVVDLREIGVEEGS